VPAGGAASEHTFRRGAASTFGLDIVARGLSAVTLVLFVRGLSIDGFAYVVLLLNWGQFGSSAATGGIRTRYVRVEAERLSRGSTERTSFFSALAGSLTLIASGAALAAGVALAVGVGGSSAADRVTFVLLAAFLTAGQAAIELAMYHHQAHLAFGRAGSIGVLRSTAMFAVAVASTVGLIQDPTAVGLGLGVAVFAVAVVFCTPLAWATRRSSAGMEGRLGFGPEANWLSVYFIVTAGVYYISLFLVAALLDDKAVASYGAAVRYLSIVLGPVPALIAVLRVRTSQQDVVDSSSRQGQMMLGWLRRTTLPVLGVLGVAALVAPFAIPLIDQGRYPDSVIVFQIGLLSVFTTYATMPATNLLMAQRRYRLLATVSGAVLVVKVALTIAAAHVWGVVGVAAVTAVASLAQDASVAYLALRNAAVIRPRWHRRSARTARGPVG
jgi:O-antigen/teichoic acid export membrane protein